jgi:hypothetical protein
MAILPPSLGGSPVSRLCTGMLSEVCGQRHRYVVRDRSDEVCARSEQGQIDRIRQMGV